MIRSSTLAAFSLLMFALPLAAQSPTSAAEPEPWTLVPQLTVGSSGFRWEQHGDGQYKVGPATKPSIGAALLHQLPNRFALEAAAAITATEYSIDTDTILGQIRGVGKIQLLRVSGGMIFRMREDVPGYLAAGLGALYYRPTQRLSAPRIDDDAQWMPQAHLGGGFDLTIEHHVARVDGRFVFSKAMQDPVPFGGNGGPLHARMVTDFLFSIGYQIPF